LNPFVTDTPVPPERLIDREAEWRQLLRYAEGGHNTRLSAPRRYGKTTLVEKLKVEAENIGMPTVYVDLFGVVSTNDVALRIESAYYEALKGAVANWFRGVRRRWRPTLRAGPGAASVEIEALAESDAEAALHELLDLPVGLFERTGKRTLVVFDEFQDVLSGGENIDSLIRSRIQHHRDEASYVFAGSHPGLMAELFGSKERPLFEQARPVVLDPLPDEALAEYIGREFERTGREAGDALDSLLALARGHPQRAMLLAHHLWEATPQRTTADDERWNNAFRTAFAELQEGFERMWQDLTANQRRVLAAVAWTGPFGGGSSLYSSDTLARFRLRKGSVRDVVAVLLSRGELEHADGSNIRIVDPVFEAWIASGRRPPS
jgi:uncharacterized protein